MKTSLRGHAHTYGKNVDTDVIIPGKYCSIVDVAELGKHALEGIDPEFTTRMKAGDIIVADSNFGCGSSREHAVWAVQQAGFRAVIAPVKGEGFADIFEGNAFNNGLLPIELPEADWRAVADACRGDGGADVTINLDAQTVTVHPARGSERSVRFEVPETQRNRLLKGLDAVAETLQNDSEIRAHESKAPVWVTPQSA